LLECRAGVDGILQSGGVGDPSRRNSRDRT